MDGSTLAGAIKLAAHAKGVSLASLGAVAGLKPDSVRARLSKSRGKRSLQPWQVTALARHLGLDEKHLHLLAARHEGWNV